MNITALVLFISIVFTLFIVIFNLYSNYALMNDQSALSSSPTLRTRYINPSYYYYIYIIFLKGTYSNIFIKKMIARLFVSQYFNKITVLVPELTA